MRGLPIRRLASTALCASLVLGIAGPSALAADSEPARDRGTAASRAPVPGADTLLDQSGTLADLGAVLTPATALLNAVAKAEDGQLSPDQATKLGEAVKDAVTQATGTTQVTPSAQTLPAEVEPQSPSASAPDAATSGVSVSGLTGLDLDGLSGLNGLNGLTDLFGSTADDPDDADDADDLADAATDAADAAPAGSATATADDDKAPAPDLKADSLAAVQTAVDDLLAAATSGSAEKARTASQGLVSALVNLIAAIQLSGGLPQPTLQTPPAS
ncbi:hypothetical protein [Streptomyces sp. NPDC006997]|uniref:hypothetical protein n=1 Tax=Streptomyces sp. NPDC006997 TaxID=3155356 RepID=UPI00340BDF6B